MTIAVTIAVTISFVEELVAGAGSSLSTLHVDLPSACVSSSKFRAVTYDHLRTSCDEFTL